jgi:hypothetical protein
LRVVAGPTVGATPAGNGGSNDGAVSRFYVAHRFADFLDYADAFMTENSSFLHTRHGATHEMQIGAADSTGGQTHNGIEIVFYGRFLAIVQSNVSKSMENDGFHGFFPGSSFLEIGPLQSFTAAARDVMKSASA